MDLSKLFLGDPPPMVPYVEPPVIGQLTEASASGNLTEVQAILSQFLAQPAPTDFELDHLVGALDKAVKNNHVKVASYLLSQGIPMNVGLFRHATQVKSYEMLQLFLDHGWNINQQLSYTKPPPLMQVTLYHTQLRTCLTSVGSPSMTKSLPNGFSTTVLTRTPNVEWIVLPCLLPLSAHPSRPSSYFSTAVARSNTDSYFSMRWSEGHQIALR
jgi:hypothetical protein